MSRGVDKRQSSLPVITKISSLSSDELAFSSRLQAMMNAKRKQFFYNLPMLKQLDLLKRQKDLSSASVDHVGKVVRELNLSYSEVVDWIAAMSRVSRISSMMDVPQSILEILEDEFELSEELSYERALILGHVMNISVDVIRKWFEMKNLSKSKQKTTFGSLTPTSIASSHGNIVVFAKRFTAKQYEILMDEFKKEATLSATKVVELASKTGLMPSQVILWFEIQQRKMKTSTVNKILQNLSKNWHRTQIIELEKQYRKRGCVSSEAAAKLSRTLNVKQEAVFMWFKRRRTYELYKFHGNNLTIIEEHKVVSDILEAEDPKVLTLVLPEKKHDFPVVCVPQCPDDPIKWSKWLENNSNKTSFLTPPKSGMKFTPEQVIVLKGIFSERNYIDVEESEDIAKQFGGQVSGKNIRRWFMKTRYNNRPAVKLNELTSTGLKTESVINRRRPGVVPLEVQDALLEEFKKSPALSPQRMSMLQNRLKLPPLRIAAFFSRMSSLLSGKTENDVTKLLIPYPSSFLSKMTAQYRKNRFVSVVRTQMLAKQLGSSKRVISDWLSNARLFELLTKNKFTLDTVRCETKKLCVSSVPSAENGVKKLGKSRKKKVTFSNLVSKLLPVSGITAKLLKDEYDRDTNVTEERIRALAKYLHVTEDCIRRWYESNLPSAISSANQKKKCVLNVDNGVDEETQTTSKQTKSSRRFQYQQLSFRSEILFNAFKVAPRRLSSSSLADLRSRSNLSSSQITKWFCRMRRKLASMSSDILLSSHRNQNLTDNQVNVLEKEFKEHPYESEEGKNSLAKKLNISRGMVKKWFFKRRQYELILSAGITLKDSASTVGIRPGEPIEKIGFEQLHLITATVSQKPVCTTTSSSADFQRKQSHQNESLNQACAKFLVNLDTMSTKLETTYPEGLGAKVYSDVIHSSNDLEDSRERVIRSDASMPKTSEIVTISSENKNDISPNSVLCIAGKQFRRSEHQSDNPAPPTVNGELALIDDFHPPLTDDSVFQAADSEQKSDNLKLKPPVTKNDTISTSTKVISAIEVADISLKQPSAKYNFNVVRVDSGKKKFAFSSHQQQILVQEFKKSPFVSAGKARMLANDLNLSRKRIEWWFEKRRSLGPFKPIKTAQEDEKLNPTTLSAWQLFVLEKEFAKNPKLTKQRVEYLCKKVRTTRREIISWFKEQKKETAI